MMRYIIFSCALTFCAGNILAQTLKKPGSYASFQPMILEDNSFLVEEAFNQDMGAIQHIGSLTFDPRHFRELLFSFTQEIPLTDQTHQLSYTLNYSLQPDVGESNGHSGFGDLSISYRPQILDESDWVMFIPRFTVIIPTGNASQGLGAGGWGFQFNAAITKRISKKIVTHYNLGATEYIGYKHFVDAGNDKIVLHQRNNLLYKNLAASLVWYIRPEFNLLTEYVVNFEKEVEDSGTINSVNVQVVNPGIRYAFSINNMQVVPGISIPLSIHQHKVNTSALFYISFEPMYR